MMRAASIVAVAAGALACSATPNILPTNDFNRPMDVAFMCLGAFGPDGGQLQVSGRPMRHCHPSAGGGAAKADPDPAPGQTVRTFAFMPNAASGDLSVIDADKWKIVDLSQNSSGYGRVPLGALPEQISVSDDGCRLVSANRGSCDLTVVDPSALLAPVFREFGDVPALDSRGVQRRRAVRADKTPLAVAPYEVVFLPTDTTGLDKEENLCPGPGSQPGTWRALVTFPSCDLVALIDLPSGDIIDSVQVKRSGDGVTAVRTGNMPVCAVADCGAPASDAGMPAGDDGGVDGAAADDGGVMNLLAAPPALPELSPAPTSIAITPAGDHAYVSLANVSAILSLDVTASSITPSVAQTSIHLEAAGGSNRIRLSVDSYAPTPDALGRAFSGKFIGKEMAFLYVIARDGSVRIVDVFNPGSERECEANIDPLGTPRPPLAGSPAIVNGCLPVGTTPRRLFADRGLRFPSIPVDVAFADVRPDVTDKPANTIEETVSGGYAWVMTSSGLVYLINIDPVPRTIEAIVRDGQTQLYTPAPDPAAPYVSDPTPVSEPPSYPGTPRNRNFLSYSGALDSVSGPPRIDLPPLWSSTETYLEGFWAKGTENNATVLNGDFKQTYVFFPDPSGAAAQAWDVTWEGLLRGQSSSGNIKLADQPGGPVTLRDGGFCSNGIVAGDIVTLNGCTNDSQCPLGAVCHQDPSVDQVPGGFTVTGLCVSPDTDKRGACTPLAGTLRRYEIASAHDNELVIQPRLDEVVRSNVAPCRPNPDSSTGAGGMGGMGGTGTGAAGMGGAGGMAGAGGTGGPVKFTDCVDPNDASTLKFVCTTDTTSPTTRCLYPCRQDMDCRAGRACLEIPQPIMTADGPMDAPNPRFANFEPGRGVCADAIVINQRECVPQYVTYQVNAARSFIVSGSATGALSGGGNPDPAKGGECTAAPPADQRMVSRIPVDVRDDKDLCQLPAPFVTPMLPGPPGQFFEPASAQFFNTPAVEPSDADAEARLRVVQAPLDPMVNNPCLFVGGPSAQDAAGPKRADIRHLRARFQNTQIAFVLSNFERAPATQMSFRLDVHGGSRPQTVLSPATAEIGMPTRLVLGPIDAPASFTKGAYEAPYLFIVDQRRLGRGQGGGPTRGQLLRIQPVGFEGAKGLQPIVEDFQRSGGLFPIQ